jgi:hypothetical protein
MAEVLGFLLSPPLPPNIYKPLRLLTQSIYRVYKKNATSEFPKKSTLQFLSIKDFKPLGIGIELLIDHITVVVLLNKCINFALCTGVCSNFDSCAILNSQEPKIFCP